MKLIREHINEKFIEDSDPIADMGIGLLSDLDEFVKLILKKDRKYLLWTVQLVYPYITIYFNSPKIRKSGLLKDKDECIQYLENILFNKMNLQSTLLDRNVEGDFHYKNNILGEVNIHVRYKFKQKFSTKKSLKFEYKRIDQEHPSLIQKESI
jgi:hypothetical protein